METNDTPSDFGKGPKGEVRRWLKELDLSDKREEDYRKIGKRVMNTYRGVGRKKNSFNILWSNTETLAPAVFNSPPKPNVSRRFKDEDPVGKVASTVVERCLMFQTDTESFMHSLALDVLDMLLPGRGISRVRYVPELVAMDGETTDGDEDAPGNETEQIAFEQCVLEHVQWGDFRIGPGKTWEQVEWVAFQHRLTRDELVEKFGDVGKTLSLDDADADDADLKSDENLASTFRTAEVWEFWCRYDKTVRWVCKAFKDSALKTQPDPLGLIGFFPVPRPLYAILDSSCLEPLTLYEQYKEQAVELDRISTRINKIVDAMKLRGMYDSTLAELSELMEAEDNKLIAVQNAAQWLDKGLDKAIWMMPIVDAANVLKVLYEQREACKQVIYEVMGIGDIMRGVSDPNETLGAQKLKAESGGKRVSKMQREVERYTRDLIRIMGEIVSEKFQPETLLKMTGMQILTEQQVQMTVQQYQNAVQQAQATGQPPPKPLPEKPVTLEQVVAVLRDDATRSFKIDVETDSMVAATMADDAQALQAVLGGVAQFMTAAAPAVQAGAMPVEAVKEIVMTICRRSRLGTAVEDALDKMKAPNPPPDPAQAVMAQEQAKMQGAAQLEQMKGQMETQKHERELQANAQAEQFRAQLDQQSEQGKAVLEAQKQQSEQAHAQSMEQTKCEHDAGMERMRQSFERWKVEFVENNKVVLAEMSAKAAMDKQAEQNANDEVAEEVAADPMKKMAQMHGDMMGQMKDLMTHIAKPKQLIRGPDGRAIGVQ